ncbi:MAG: DUF4928 family protein [Nitrospirae bacterium]|nr:DUF4928 family protein [Nitrospirota bacterium]
MEKSLELFEVWYNHLPVHKTSGGPAKGTIAAALAVLEKLKEDYRLEIEAHTALGGAQISGASGQAVKKVLAIFGETRPFAKEGGRTNRGGRGDIKKMLDALKNGNLDKLAANRRNEILSGMQRFLVGKVVEFHNRQRIKMIYDPAMSTWQNILELLSAARETGKEGPVAQHLVGAKLQLRFPDIEVSNESYSTADEQLGRPGDFYIGDTAFHVTVAPMGPVYEKCRENLENGYRVFLLVPERAQTGARQNAELMVPGRIAVESIESFVGQNIEELSYFSRDKLKNGFRRLLETYNNRVDEAEIDKSMLIEIPKNL